MFQVFDSSGDAVPSSGIIIPQNNLQGFGLTSFETAETKQGVQRAVFAILKAIQAFPFTGFVGLTKQPPTNAISGQNVNRSYSVTATWMHRMGNDTFEVIPLPTTGANAGIGGVEIYDIFNMAQKVASGDSVDNPGLFIPIADLAPYGLPDFPSLDFQDSDHGRLFISSLYWYLASSSDPNLQPRSATENSAIVARNNPGFFIGTLPPNATATTDPTTNLIPAELNTLALTSKTPSITFQLALNDANDTYDLSFSTL